MNNQQRAAMQMALEALERLDNWFDIRELKLANTHEAITALRLALAQPTPQEITVFEGYISNAQTEALRKALAQPQGDWVDLTRDDVESLFWPWKAKTEYEIPLFEYRVIAAEVIAKFKSKNTPPVVPQGEPVAYFYKDEVILAKHWTADCPPSGWTQLYTTPPSVEAMRIETLEKAAKVCEGMIDGVTTFACCAAAIRSME
jgi:hypothetical protein